MHRRNKNEEHKPKKKPGSAEEEESSKKEDRSISKEVLLIKRMRSIARKKVKEAIKMMMEGWKKTSET